MYHERSANPQHLLAYCPTDASGHSVAKRYGVRKSFSNKNPYTPLVFHKVRREHVVDPHDVCRREVRIVCVIVPRLEDRELARTLLRLHSGILRRRQRRSRARWQRCGRPNRRHNVRNRRRVDSANRCREESRSIRRRQHRATKITRRRRRHKSLLRQSNSKPTKQ
jgi:hypothetical protein